MAGELKEAWYGCPAYVETYVLKSSGIFPDLWMFSQCPLFCFSLEVPSEPCKNKNLLQATTSPSLIKFRMELHFSAELAKSNTNLQVRTLLLWCWGLFCFLWYRLGAKEIQTGSMWCTKDTMTGFQGWVLHKHSFNDCLTSCPSQWVMSLIFLWLMGKKCPDQILLLHRVKFSCKTKQSSN